MLTLVTVLAAAVAAFLFLRSRNPARRLAAAEGWQSAGTGQFRGQIGDSQWRGGAQQDDDTGACWTEFEAGVPGLSPGGFVIVSRADWQQSLATQRERESRGTAASLLARADAALDTAVDGFVSRLAGVATGAAADPAADFADDRRTWQAQDVGSAAFRATWVLLASEPRWSRVLTPDVERLWLALQAPGPAAGSLHVHGQQYRLNLRRDDGRSQAPLDDVAALLRLGVALLISARAAAQG